MNGRSRWRLAAFWTPLVFILDQASKLVIVLAIGAGEKIEVVPHLFDIVHATNPGAAFGLFSELPDSLRVPFFAVSSTIALALIVFYFVSLKEERPAPYRALSLILGGALGNIFDRIVRGEVVDFLSFHWYDSAAEIDWGSFYWHFKLEWPAFNIADAAITVGVFWLMGLMLAAGRKG